eukprot:TRINITY_DN2779_c0_g1_i1.p1 TRINITY_DN2779_c0_g1~~TRINITY_DN2779_c0_g1_i1.p1  ORF type:complete len:369 (-),score=8.75 TRINITY_DN2779_c0_g1_i1:13-1119(-)
MAHLHILFLLLFAIVFCDRFCHLSNTDFVVYLTRRDFGIVKALTTSIQAFAPTYRELLVFADDIGMLLKHQDLPVRLRFVPFVIPPEIRSVLWGNLPDRFDIGEARDAGYIAQAYIAFWMDNFTDARFVTFMDPDSFLTVPFTCSVALDEKALPYWYHFGSSNSHFKYVCDILVGNCTNNYMAVFPITIPHATFAAARLRILDNSGLSAPSRNFDSVFVQLMMKLKAHIAQVSQFYVLGNLAEQLKQIHPVHVEAGQPQQMLPGFHKWQPSMLVKDSNAAASYREQHKLFPHAKWRHYFYSFSKRIQHYGHCLDLLARNVSMPMQCHAPFWNLKPPPPPLFGDYSMVDSNYWLPKLAKRLKNERCPCT